MDQVFLHRNGGGRIVGADGAIGSDCYLEPGSEMRGTSIVSCMAEIRDQSILDNSTLVAAVIEHHSIALNSHIHYAQVGKSLLRDVVVRGANERFAHLYNVVLLDGVVVENCRLQDFELCGPHLLHVDWDRAPRHRVITPGPGMAMALTECADDHFHVGCECRSFAEWDEKESVLRRYFVDRHHWLPEVFNSIRTTFEKWRREVGSEPQRLSGAARSIA